MRALHSAFAKCAAFVLIAGLGGCAAAENEALCRMPANWKEFDARTDCRLETGDFRGEGESTVPESVSIVAYNVEHGARYDQILRFFRSDPRFSRPDVLLLSEADRNRASGGVQDTARDLARELQMAFVFAVEFLESDSPTFERPCEHGNAILSRFPIRSWKRIDHRVHDRRFEDPEARAPFQVGGRMALRADLEIGEGVLRVYALHLASGPEDNRRRAAEAGDIVADAADWSGPVVAGGDLNTGLYLLDLLGGSRLDKTPPIFFEAGFEDAHRGLPLEERPTAGPYRGTRLLLDLLFVRGIPVQESLVCPLESCGGISDHVPILTRVDWRRRIPTESRDPGRTG